MRSTDALQVERMCPKCQHLKHCNLLTLKESIDANDHPTLMNSLAASFSAATAGHLTQVALYPPGSQTIPTFTVSGEHPPIEATTGHLLQRRRG